MAEAFLFRNGGSNPLNFKVVGGTSAPSNPKENTIWCNTNVAISNWVFANNDPNLLDFSTKPGSVWIVTGKQSAVGFNALKKNSVKVSPVMAKQYVNGTWKKQEAFVYQGGKWKNVAYIVIPDVSRTWTNTKTEVSNTESGAVLTHSLKSSTNGKVGTAESYTEIDLTDYDTLYVKGSHSVNNTSGSDQTWQLGLYTTSGTLVSTVFTRGLIPNKTDFGSQAFERTIDISSLSGVYCLKSIAETWSVITVPHVVTITSAYLK